MKLAVATVFYKGVESYAPDFLDGLRRQTDTEFTLVIANDGMAEVERLMAGYLLPCELFDVAGTPAGVRKQLLRRVAEAGYEVVILADADDVCSDNRVAVCRALLERENLVATDLVLWDSGSGSREPWLRQRFGSERRIDLDDLRDANCCGGSNMAARVAELTLHIDAVQDHLVAFDWALFTRVLLTGGSVRFTDQARSDYRQHGSNLAAPFGFDEESVFRGVRVKAQHYAALSDCPGFSARARSFSELEQRLLASTELLSRYTAAVREHCPATPLWWEAIRPAEELLP